MHTDIAADSTFQIGDILRQVSNILYIPVIVLLIFCIAMAVFLLGWAIGEYFSERRHMKVHMPEFLEQLRAASGTPEGCAPCIRASLLLKRQKALLLELLAHPDFSDTMRQALAVRLLEEEQIRYDRRIRRSEMLARIAPMLGLMGTLIPLGPGIIALGQGDTFTLSSSLLTAFDTTVAGLASAAVAAIISAIRRDWYKNDMSALETAAECLLEMEKSHAETKSEH